MLDHKLPITAIIATRNEEANIDYCLQSLYPVERVIVVDSNSQDATRKIARERGAETVEFKYQGGYPKKRQWVMETMDINTQWIFLVDADEIIPDELWQEISCEIQKPKNADAYLINKRFCFMGRCFRFGGFSHSAVLLFKKGSVEFECMTKGPKDIMDMEIHERLLVKGVLKKLKNSLIHQDRKGMRAYIRRHNQYSKWEAEARLKFINTGAWGENTIKSDPFAGVQERRRFLKSIATHIPLEPQLWFLYHYIIRLGFMEGRAGLIASIIRAKYIGKIRKRIAKTK